MLAHILAVKLRSMNVVRMVKVSIFAMIVDGGNKNVAIMLLLRGSTLGIYRSSLYSRFILPFSMSFNWATETCRKSRNGVCTMVTSNLTLSTDRRLTGILLLSFNCGRTKEGKVNVLALMIFEELSSDAVRMVSNRDWTLK